MVLRSIRSMYSVPECYSIIDILVGGVDYDGGIHCQFKMSFVC